MIIGQRVKQARLDKQYTQEDLGELLGVSKVSICGYETGKRTPTMAVFLKLSSILDVTVDYLLGNDKKVIAEDEEEYTTYVAKVDLEILSEIKKYNSLYQLLCNDPVRIIKLINRKIT